MTVTFRMHKPDKNMAKWAEVQGRKIKQRLDAILEEVITEAADDMVAILEAAVTATGEARVARGGNGPGRVDTEKMRKAIKSRILSKTKERSVGAWGWLDEVLDYFVYQEYGAEEFGVHFEGMAALQGSFIMAREKFHKRLQQIGREV